MAALTTGSLVHVTVDGGKKRLKITSCVLLSGRGREIQPPCQIKPTGLITFMNIRALKGQCSSYTQKHV